MTETDAEAGRWLDHFPDREDLRHGGDVYWWAYADEGPAVAEPCMVILTRYLADPSRLAEQLRQGAVVGWRVEVDGGMETMSIGGWTSGFSWWSEPITPPHPPEAP